MAYKFFANKFFLIMLVNKKRLIIRKAVMLLEKAGRIIRLICMALISVWLTGKVVVFSPIFAIMLIGCTVLFMINEITEIKNENKAKKRSARNKKVKSTKS